MLVSHTKKFIYLKTIKTAGTSVEIALQKYCVPPEREVDEITPAIETEFGIVGARGPDVKDQPWRNHMSAAAIKKRLPPSVWEGYHKICNIRNPWDKTVSFFHMQFKDIKSAKPEDIFASFRVWLKEARIVGKDTDIYFIDGRPVADDYIKYDSMLQDFSVISNKLDLEVEMALPQAKSGSRGAVKLPFCDYYDSDSKQKVADMYPDEIRAFGWRFD